MADGHFPDVELLRRELAVLILEWAGKAVKDDPDGPMATALTRAVGEAARDAVSEQHQALTADAADRIAEALDRRNGGLFVWRATLWSLGLGAVAAAGMLCAAFLLGLQTGRTENALPAAPAPAAAATAAPIAPLAPAADTPAVRRAEAPKPAPPRQLAAPPAARPARVQPRELGRPAPVSEETATRSAQPVGAATTTPTTAAPKAEAKP